MGTLYVVGTPIGNLGDMSKRAINILSSVSLIACEDTRVSVNLLRYFNINNKLVSYHKFNEQEKSSYLIDILKNDQDIALISDAGCPCISDPGSILVKGCLDNGISVVAIPGSSAIITALMVSGMDTRSFAFYGFLERENKKIEESLMKIKNDSCNLSVIYESPKRIIKTLNKIEEVLGDVSVCVCNDLTKKFEKKYYGKIANVKEEMLNNENYELGEYVIVIEKSENTINEESEQVSMEALLVDTLLKNNCTMKEAIKLVSEKYSYSKNSVYNASLNLKKMFDK